MLVRFWGTRGSLPAPLGAAAVREKLREALLKASGRRFETDADADAFIDLELDFATGSTFGGNSPCVEIDAGSDEFVFCDLGSGLRAFGNYAMAKPKRRKDPVYHAFVSHMHWDHIMGFPFFVPAYVPGHRTIIHGCHPNIEAALRRQHAAPSFPVEYDQLGGTIVYDIMTPGMPVQVAGMTVHSIPQYHSGDSFGYRFEKDGKTVVYSTDSEHKLDNPEHTEAFVEFFRGADVVIFDTMYSLADALTIRQDWGHSSNIVAVELCHRAGVKTLCLFHHDPNSDDRAIATLHDETVRFEELSRESSPLRVLAAYDGMEIRL